MSVDIVRYNASNNLKGFLNFKLKPCARDIIDPLFVRPTPQEVKELRLIMGFSQSDIAVLAGVSYSVKGASAVRKWETKEGKEARKIPLSAWRLMLIKSGLASITPLKL